MKIDPREGHVDQLTGEVSLYRCNNHGYSEVDLFAAADGSWRPRLVASKKEFDDERKGVYLREMMIHGRVADSAATAGVTTQTIRTHRSKDEEFREAEDFAKEIYRDRLLAHHQELVFHGSERKTFDRNGNVVNSERVYYPRLIELELKKMDPAYRDKQEVDFRVSGGVVIAPSETRTIDDWESKYGGRTIEGSATEVE